jgi:hypothetical protein
MEPVVILGEGHVLTYLQGDVAALADHGMFCASDPPELPQ